MIWWTGAIKHALENTKNDFIVRTNVYICSGIILISYINMNIQYQSIQKSLDVRYGSLYLEKASGVINSEVYGYYINFWTILLSKVSNINTTIYRREDEIEISNHGVIEKNYFTIAEGGQWKLELGDKTARLWTLSSNAWNIESCNFTKSNGKISIRNTVVNIKARIFEECDMEAKSVEMGNYMRYYNCASEICHLRVNQLAWKIYNVAE